MHSPAENTLPGGHSTIMDKPVSIASVTVAYNGAGVLREHIESLRKQTRKLDEIIVIDNASDDDTRDVLANEYPEVTVLAFAENRGIAGGLAAGLAYALSRNYEWIWLFDQDSLPSGNALEQLLAGLGYLHGSEDTIGILAPVCANQETGMTYPGLSWQRSRFAPSRTQSEQPVTFVDMVITSGSLVRRESIEKAGLPRADFFMDFVDYEHCLRIRRHGFRIAVVRDSVLQHAIGEPRTVNILGRTMPWADHAPWREYYMARNETYTIWQYYPRLATKTFVLYRFLQHAFGVLLFGKSKAACFRMMWHGFCDGRAGRLAVRFLPGSAKRPPLSAPHSPKIAYGGESDS
ncbi:MAG TPA: glycosyltransferase family 2 protein [Candidatus Sulfotelmatobacter sp.]|jgi:rhamnosyltransferase|nr:glycosyltransferase family 2 protein [Candidatus Sulfotelmatobacter sp.]